MQKKTRIKLNTVQPFSQPYFSNLLEVLKHWRDVCVCVQLLSPVPEHPNCKPLIRAMFWAATWYICQCYQCLRLQTWQKCYSTETHGCCDGLCTSACAREHMRGMTRIIPTTQSSVMRVVACEIRLYWETADLRDNTELTYKCKEISCCITCTCNRFYYCNSIAWEG